MEVRDERSVAVYLAGCRAKAPAHPSEQKWYSTPSWLSRPTPCQGSTAIRQTGSIGSPVTDGLDLISLMLGQQPAHGDAEPGDQVDGVLVPMCLGQGGVQHQATGQRWSLVGASHAVRDRAERQGCA